MHTRYFSILPRFKVFENNNLNMEGDITDRHFWSMLLLYHNAWCMLIMFFGVEINK